MSLQGDSKPDPGHNVSEKYRTRPVGPPEMILGKSVSIVKGGSILDGILCNRRGEVKGGSGNLPCEYFCLPFFLILCILPVRVIW